jgi:hypothetical protein
MQSARDSVQQVLAVRDEQHLVRFLEGLETLNCSLHLCAIVGRLRATSGLFREVLVAARGACPTSSSGIERAAAVDSECDLFHASTLSPGAVSTKGPVIISFAALDPLGAT